MEIVRNDDGSLVVPVETRPHDADDTDATDASPLVSLSSGVRPPHAKKRSRATQAPRMVRS